MQTHWNTTAGGVLRLVSYSCHSGWPSCHWWGEQEHRRGHDTPRGTVVQDKYKAVTSSPYNPRANAKER